MRYDKGHKDTSRNRIVDVASRRFRKDGVAAVGIASLMADAGLTHGGFYAHFGSKEALAREALADALRHTGGRLARAAEDGGLEAVVSTYLHAAHRDSPDQGCAIASLAAEIARHPAETRAPLTQGLEHILDTIAAQLDDLDAAARRARALSIFAVMMGSLQLARMVTDPGQSDLILENGRAAALALSRVP